MLRAFYSSHRTDGRGVPLGVWRSYGVTYYPFPSHFTTPGGLSRIPFAFPPKFWNFPIKRPFAPSTCSTCLCGREAEPFQIIIRTLLGEAVSKRGIFPRGVFDERVVGFRLTGFTVKRTVRIGFCFCEPIG